MGLQNEYERLQVGLESVSLSLPRLVRENARSLEVRLDFLDPDRSYRAQIYRDGANADWRAHPFAIAIERREVRRDDTLQLKLAPGGGQAIRFQAR